MTTREVITEPGAEAILDPRCIATYRYWERLRGTRPAPTRKEIDPAALRAVLPYIFMLDVFYDPLRFRFRLIGTGIVTFVGRDSTGKDVTYENYGPYAASLYLLYKTVSERCAPVGFKGSVFYRPGREWQQTEALLLPLCDEGRLVNKIIACYTPVERAHNPRVTQRPIDLNEEMISRGFRIIPDPILPKIDQVEPA